MKLISKLVVEYIISCCPYPARHPQPRDPHPRELGESQPEEF